MRRGLTVLLVALGLILGGTVPASADYVGGAMYSLDDENAVKYTYKFACDNCPTWYEALNPANTSTPASRDVIRIFINPCWRADLLRSDGQRWVQGGGYAGGVWINIAPDNSGITVFDFWKFSPSCD